MKLDWLGREASDSQTRKTFRNVLIVFVTYLILSNTFSVSNATIYEIDEKGEIQVDPPPKPSTSLLIINKIVYISFAIYALIIMLRTRRTVRERYQIPEVYCPNGMEDLFCSVFCGSCAVAQMARHTADYGHERSLCCSTTGLPNFNPVMIV